MIHRICAAVLLLALTGTAAAIELPGPLVSPAWLHAHQGEVNILAVREDAKSFTAAPELRMGSTGRELVRIGGHIRGALLLDFSLARTAVQAGGQETGWMLPGRAAFEELMRAAGVRGDRPVIIVSPGLADSDLDMAARVYWSLKVHGAQDIAILDGGASAWLAAGLPFSRGPVPRERGDWSAGTERAALRADSAAVAAGERQVVDARPLPFFVGLERKPVVLQAGHIPGAVNFPPDVRGVSRDGSVHFLSAAQYRAIFAQLGLDAEAPTITYCNTGQLAAGAWFVFSEILGNPQVSLYDGSMHAWTQEGRPVIGLE